MKTDERKLVTLAEIRKNVRLRAWVEIGGAALEVVLTALLAAMVGWLYAIGENTANPALARIVFAPFWIPVVFVGGLTVMQIVRAVRESRMAFGQQYRIELDKLYRVGEDEPANLSFYERSSFFDRRFWLVHRTRMLMPVKAYYFETFGRAICERAHIRGVDIEGHLYYLVVTKKGDRVLCAYDTTTHCLEETV